MAIRRHRYYGAEGRRQHHDFSQVRNSGYSSGGANRVKKALIGWQTAGGDAEEDIHVHLDLLRRRCRDLYTSAPIAASAVNTCRTNVIGPGLQLKAMPDQSILGLSDEETAQLKRNIEREFSLWADTPMCDADRLDNFYELQQLAFLNWMLSGDVLVLLPVSKRVGEVYDLRIRLIEADRVETPPDKESDGNISHGVEKDADGAVCAYYIRNTHPYSADRMEAVKYERVEAYGKKTGRRNAIHIMSRERIGQLRGVPFLSPIIEALKQVSRYTEAELMAAVVNGLFTTFIEKQDNSDGIPFGETIPEEEQVDGRDGNSIEMGNGNVIELLPGEKVASVSPGRPNANFNGFVEAIVKQIGAALEIPYELMIKNFTKSYSASRAALLEAWKMFRMKRKWMIADFCQPIYEEWFAEAAAKGRIRAPGFFSDPLIRKAYTACEWNGPTQGQLDPVKEANAAVIRIENGLSTRQREAQEITGTDFTQNAAQLSAENKIFTPPEITYQRLLDSEGLDSDQTDEDETEERKG